MGEDKPYALHSGIKFKFEAFRGMMKNYDRLCKFERILLIKSQISAHRLGCSLGEHLTRQLRRESKLSKSIL